MPIAAIICVFLIALTTLIHYEVLRAISFYLKSLPIPNRTKLLVVVYGSFFAHALEIAVYGLSIFALHSYAQLGSLVSSTPTSLTTCLYFSAETFTSLGFGDITPTGPLRLLAGFEALNGLLLIGWSASFTYIAMERFWKDPK